MAKRHLFALNAPVNWPIKRKEQKWVIRPSPGPHPLKRCLPLNLLFTGILDYARTSREVRKILHDGEIFVDGRSVKNQKFPVGVMDHIGIKSKNENLADSFGSMPKSSAVEIVAPLRDIPGRTAIP